MTDSTDMYPFNEIEGKSMTVFFPGVGPKTMFSSNADYDELVDAVYDNDLDTVVELFDLPSRVEAISKGRVEVTREGVFINGERRGGKIVDRIMQMLHRGAKTITHFTAFLENREANPDVDARESVYDFIQHCSLPITPDGCFLAYKFVRHDYMDWYTGCTHENRVGAHISMPREQVCADRNVSCAPGLHACSKEYVSNWGGRGLRMMVIKVNPRDVVSVPYSYNMEKMRVCAYEVVEELNGWLNTPEDEIEHYVTTKHGAVDPTNPADYAPAPTPVVAETVEDDDDEPVEVGKPDYSQKLDAAKVRRFKALLPQVENGTMTLTALCARFGISRRTGGRIRDGELWSNVN